MMRLPFFRSLASNRSFSSGFKALPANLLSLPGTKVTTLKNGLRVATEETPGHPKTTVGIWLDAGSAFEAPEHNGTAHFLEHLLFKGTPTRTRSSIEKEVESMGAHLNAYTSREQTVYFAHCLNPNSAQCVDILADISQNSSMSYEAIEAERSVILQEKESVEEKPDEVVFDYLHAAAYQGHGLGRTILGTVHNIKTINREMVQQYVKTHYKPNRMVLAAAGGVNHAEMVALAEKKFGHLVPESNSFIARPAEIVPFTGSEIRLQDETMTEAHVAFAAESVGWSHPDFYVFQVLCAIIGNYTRETGKANHHGGAFIEKVAEERIAHSIQPFGMHYNNTGLFGVYVVGDPETLDTLACYTLSEWVRISRNVTETEVQRAKNLVQQSHLMQLNTCKSSTEEIGRQMIALGRRIPAAEAFVRVQEVTAADVRRVATEYLTDVDIAVAAIGPLSNLPDYNYLRGWTYWNRL